MNLKKGAPHQNLWVIDWVLAGGNAFFQASAGLEESSDSGLIDSDGRDGLWAAELTDIVLATEWLSIAFAK